MGNGFTTEQMLEKIWDDVKETRQDVKKIVEDGCPLGKAHNGRIGSLERWRTRGIIGLICAMASAIAAYFGLK